MRQCVTRSIEHSILLKNPPKNVCTHAHAHLQFQIGYEEPTCFTRSVLPTVLLALQACGILKDIDTGRMIHSNATQRGDISDVFIASSFIDMYAKCGSMSEACKVFEQVPNPDVVCWNALIQGHAKNGESQDALETFAWMQERCIEINSRTLVAVLATCSSLADDEQGELVNGKVLKMKCLGRVMDVHSRGGEGSLRNIFIANSLIDIYGKCGCLREARSVFDRMQFHDVISWNSMILGYVENGESCLGIDLFTSMQRTGCEPNTRSLVAVFTACANAAAKEEIDIHTGVKLSCLERGMEIHSGAEFRHDVFMGNALIEMYAKCLSMRDAQRVFDEMKLHDVVSWTSLILGYGQNNHGDLALKVFSYMKSAVGCEVDAGAYVAALVAISAADGNKFNRLEKVREIHSEAEEDGVLSDIMFCNSLIETYSRCGSTSEARSVFDSIHNPSTLSWNSLILAYEDNGESELALAVYKQVPVTLLNARTFIAALTACTNSKWLEEGRKVHDDAVRLKMHTDTLVGTSVVNMYSKCGCMREAHAAFNMVSVHDVVLWTILITGYVENGEGKTSLGLFEEMKSRGFVPNTRTYLAALSACESLEKLMEIHSEAGLHAEMFIANRLIDLYAKFSDLVGSRSVFDTMPCHNIVSWTAMMRGSVENNEQDLALELFVCMRGLEPDTGAYLAALMAVGKLGDSQTGRSIHAGICYRGFEEEITVGTSLVDFYGKCGQMNTAQFMFDSFVSSTSGTVTWNALLAGYSHQGDMSKVVEVFNMMQEVDEITFVGVLGACSHAGRLETGRKCLQEMLPVYGVVPRVEHYTCVVDMLGRGKRLEEAVCVARSMPEEDVLVWTSLLGACWRWKNYEIGRVAFDALVGIDPHQTVAYVLMANIYESLGMWEHVLYLNRN